MSLYTVIGQSITEPVTLAAVKARIKLTSTADDDIITGQITQAREFAERVSRRSLAYKAYSYTMDRFWQTHPREPIRVPVPPLISVTSLAYLDDTLTLQTIESDEYFVANAQDPSLIVPIPGLIWPSTARVPGAVTIAFNAGFGYPGASGSPPIPAGPMLSQGWINNLVDITVFIYENAGEVIPERLVQIPKIYLF